MNKNLIFLAGILIWNCTSSVVTPSIEQNHNSSTDTSTPYPIYKVPEAIEAPLSYKNLPLELHRQVNIPVITAKNGKIGIVSIGMSNGLQQFNRLNLGMQNVWQNEINPQIQFVNCALGGNAIERWNNPEFDEILWNRCFSLIESAGLDISQVKVILHKAANQFTSGPGLIRLPLYPDSLSNYFSFQRNLDTFSHRVIEKFPEVQAVFTTSRSYGGFTDRHERGEPLSYEEGHALNTWLKQNEEINGVWFGWGPYIWAPNCASGILNGHGLCYVRSDYQADAVHPSSTGEVKVARLWHEILSKYDWYRKQ